MNLLRLNTNSAVTGEGEIINVIEKLGYHAQLKTEN